jgi:poly(A) polymerase
VAFTDDWRLDAERRDFTINALYFDPHAEQLFDYFDGEQDLANGQVRFIGDPRQRIAEDHLRILRFFRFHARFGRGAEPDTAGLSACIARAKDLMALSRERIADEWLKLLALPDPGPSVRIMVERGILAPVLPEIVAERLPRLATLIGAEDAAGIAPDPLRRFAALLPPDPLLAEKVAARLKLSNKARKRLALASDADLDLGPQALAYRIGSEHAIDRLLLAGQVEQARGLSGWTVPKLPISGGGLIARGLPPGPAIARTLKAIEAAWVAEGFPDEPRFAQLVDEALTGAAQGEQAAP